MGPRSGPAGHGKTTIAEAGNLGYPLIFDFSKKIFMSLPQIETHGNQKEDEAGEEYVLGDFEFVVFVCDDLDEGFLRLSARCDISVINLWGENQNGK